MMLPRRILAVAYCHTALADIGLNLREVETAGLPFEGLTDATMLEENSDRVRFENDGVVFARIPDEDVNEFESELFFKGLRQRSEGQSGQAAAYAEDIIKQMREQQVRKLLKMTTQKNLETFDETIRQEYAGELGVLGRVVGELHAEIEDETGDLKAARASATGTQIAEEAAGTAVALKNKGLNPQAMKDAVVKAESAAAARAESIAGSA